MRRKSWQHRKAFLIFLLILVPALLFLAWSQAAFNLSFIRPRTAWETILLLAISIFIFLAFVIFALILLRILLKLYAERRQEQLGSRFKTKMVAAFLGLSLVPVCFLFAFAYGLLNRSIDKWFGIPFDIVRKDANEIVQQLVVETEQRALDDSGHLAANAELRQQLSRERLEGQPTLRLLLVRQLAGLSLHSVVCFDPAGNVLARVGEPSPKLSEIEHLFPQILSTGVPAGGVTARWSSSDSDLFLAARSVKLAGGRLLGTVVSVRRLAPHIQEVADQIQQEARRYDQLSRERKAVKLTYVSMLFLVTLLILFVATWLAMFFAKQVTVPVQALAEATHEVSRGNLGFQISARADGELGSLIRLFNQMSLQLQESRLTIEKATQDLQRANRELEERGNTMEAILENIPTGVISFGTQGQIARVNSTVERMLGSDAVRSARNLFDLFSPEDAREISQLFRRATRQGVVTRQMQLGLGVRRAVVALTLSSIRAQHGTVGWVLVLEDLTELLRAQKAVAWQEVAQRLAHEIKNPLTPIQLSTERIRRLIERAPSLSGQGLLAAVAESASLIGREAASLKTLVDEFSSFARFPASQLAPSRLNDIIENALNVFDGRLSGIRVHRELAPHLPSVQADPEQMKRVIVNLLDNAAEALEQSATQEIWVRTELDSDREVAAIIVADSGPGIPLEAKERLFLPFFSTKQRGTGLGLAIVSRIVSEHAGWIRVEENQPTGTRFVIELPVERGRSEG